MVHKVRAARTFFRSFYALIGLLQFRIRAKLDQTVKSVEFDRGTPLQLEHIKRQIGKVFPSAMHVRSCCRRREQVWIPGISPI